MVAANAIEYHRAAAKERQVEAAAKGVLGGAPTIKQRLAADTSKDYTETLSAPGALTLAEYESPKPSIASIVEFPAQPGKAAVLAALEHNLAKPDDTGKAAAAAAREVSVSPRAVEQAVFIKEQGTPEDVADARAETIRRHNPALAEHAENEFRKEFTASERVDIGRLIEAEIGDRRGGDRKSTDKILPVDPVAGKKTAEVAAKAAGFGNPETYRQAKAVVEKAEPKYRVKALLTLIDSDRRHG